MNCLWIVCVLGVARGASVQSGNVQWFDLEAAQKHPEQLHILRTKAGINFQPYEQAWKEFKILHGRLDCLHILKCIRKKEGDV